MVKLSTIIVAVSCLAATSVLADDDISALQGSWRAKSATRNGSSADDVIGHRLKFREDRFEIRSKTGTVLFEGDFAIQADEAPARIDFTHTGKKMKGTVWKGIFERKGKRLQICDNAPNTKQPRPEKFEAPQKSGYVLVVFERIEE